MTTGEEYILAFRLSADSTLLALRLVNVLRVLPVVAIQPVVDSPPLVRGLINVEGEIVPILDLHQVFGLPLQDLELTDSIVLAVACDRTLGFVVTEATGVQALDRTRLVKASDAIPGTDTSIEGVVVTEDGMILVYDLPRLLVSAGGEQLAAFLEDNA